MSSSNGITWRVGDLWYRYKVWVKYNINIEYYFYDIILIKLLLWLLNVLLLLLLFISYLSSWFFFANSENLNLWASRPQVSSRTCDGSFLSPPSLLLLLPLHLVACLDFSTRILLSWRSYVAVLSTFCSFLKGHFCLPPPTELLLTCSTISHFEFSPFFYECDLVGDKIFSSFFFVWWRIIYS